jgi:Mg/Co/Ni transporter MgtE
MTTEYFAINDNLAVSEALDLIRKHKPEAESIYYVYVVDDSNRLRGVISLVDLVTGSPEVRISAIMNENVVKVGLTTKHYEVAKVVAKYNLLAVPVVDENNTLMGIVTVDDAIDIVIPTAYKKRIPRIYS